MLQASAGAAELRWEVVAVGWSFPFFVPFLPAAAESKLWETLRARAGVV